MSFDWKSTPLVKPAKRYQGQFIDGLVSLVLFVPSLYVAKWLFAEGLAADLFTLALPLGYFLLSDGLPHGQSLGKKILRISVVDMRTGKACTLLGSLLRNGPALVLGSIDAILILFRRRQRLGDLLARTVVINGMPKGE